MERFPGPSVAEQSEHAEPTGPERAEQVRAMATAHLAEPGPLLPVLHDVLERFGWVADADAVEIADVLNLSRADVHGVISFYTDFRRTPPPAHLVTLCRAEACQAVGAQALYAAARERFDGVADVEVAEVFCLGNCALGPSGTVDGRLHGRLTAERVESLATGWDR